MARHPLMLHESLAYQFKNPSQLFVQSAAFKVPLSNRFNNDKKIENLVHSIDLQHIFTVNDLARVKRPRIIW